MAETKLDHLREALAELEHIQWMAWSKHLAQSERLSADRVATWETMWRPYSELTEEQKDQDREWADRVLNIVRSAAIERL